jgi:hypothetical protein
MSTRHDKLFFTKEYVMCIDEIQKKINPNVDEPNDDDKNIQDAPNINELEDHERFKDMDGKLLNIETRPTERKPYCVFFKVKDVEEAFNMPNITNRNIKK